MQKRESLISAAEEDDVISQSSCAFLHENSSFICSYRNMPKEESLRNGLFTHMFFW